MNEHFKNFDRFFRTTLERLPELERRVVASVFERRRVSRDVNLEFAEKQKFGDRVADRVASFGGSWTFISIFFGVLFAWVVFNSLAPLLLPPANGAGEAATTTAFDPYPFILLNLFLSTITALQAPIIMMSQNRQAAKDRLDAAQDYEVNLKAEIEITALHEKIDRLRDEHLTEIIRLQQTQIALLSERLDDLGAKKQQEPAN